MNATHTKEAEQILRQAAKLAMYYGSYGLRPEACQQAAERVVRRWKSAHAA